LESLHRLFALDLKTKLSNALFVLRSSPKPGNSLMEVFGRLQRERFAFGSLVTAKMA
jgi:hypothetical protein